MSGVQLDADAYGEITDITYLDDIGFQFNVSTTDAIGTFVIEGSIDGENWATVPSSSSGASLTGVSGTLLLSATLLPFPYIRAKYVRTSGDGVCDGYISAKMI